MEKLYIKGSIFATNNCKTVLSFYNSMRERKRERERGKREREKEREREREREREEREGERGN